MSDLNSKVNTSDVLSLKEIQASTDLTNKVASASGLKDISTKVANIDSTIHIGSTSEDNNFSFIPRNVGEGVFILFSNVGLRILGILGVSENGYGFIHPISPTEVRISYGSQDDTVTFYTGGWYNRIYARRIA